MSLQVSFVGPLQFLPPFDGLGFVHVLVLVPRLQFNEHLDQGLKPPFTGGGFQIGAIGRHLPKNDRLL